MVRTKEMIKKIGFYLLLLMISPIVFIVALGTQGNRRRQRHYLVFLLSPSILMVGFVVYFLVREYPSYRLYALGAIWFISFFVFLFGSMPASITAALSGMAKMVCKHYWQWILATTFIGTVISSILGWLFVETSEAFWQFGLMGGVCALSSSCILWWFDKYRP